MRDMSQRIRRTLTTTEGPIVADILPLSSDLPPLVEVVSFPSVLWTRVQAYRAVCLAVADGRVRL